MQQEDYTAVPDYIECSLFYCDDRLKFINREPIETYTGNAGGLLNIQSGSASARVFLFKTMKKKIETEKEREQKQNFANLLK